MTWMLIVVALIGGQVHSYYGRDLMIVECLEKAEEQRMRFAERGVEAIVHCDQVPIEQDV